LALKESYRRLCGSFHLEEPVLGSFLVGMGEVRMKTSNRP